MIESVATTAERRIEVDRYDFQGIVGVLYVSWPEDTEPHDTDFGPTISAGLTADECRRIGTALLELAMGHES